MKMKYLFTLVISVIVIYYLINVAIITYALYSFSAQHSQKLQCANPRIELTDECRALFDDQELKTWNSNRSNYLSRLERKEMIQYLKEELEIEKLRRQIHHLRHQPLGQGQSQYNPSNE